MEELKKRIEEKIHLFYFQKERHPRCIILHPNDLDVLKAWNEMFSSPEPGVFFIGAMQAFGSLDVAENEFCIF